jgi:hypothetical protein
LIILSSLISLIYLGFISAEQTSPTASIRQGLGKVVFGAVVGLELMMVFFITCFDRRIYCLRTKRQTYDLLRTTTLAGKIVGIRKISFSFSFPGDFIICRLSLQSMAFLFGGISIERSVNCIADVACYCIVL